jgi:glycosyltransferase involved in cell wall biosynthesis
MSEELISIVMTVKNEAQYLSACFDSILAQDYPNWELICVDDHSTDETYQIAKDYQDRDARIRVLNHEGLGILPALITAYRHSRGNYITRMDGDDLMPSDKLRTLLSLCRRNPGTVATGKVKYFSTQPVSPGYQAYENWLNQLCTDQTHRNWVYRECVLASPNWLCERETIERVGGFEGLSYPEDYDLVLKWVTAGVPIMASTQITHLWREHPERTSRNSKVYEQKSFFALKFTYLVKELTGKSVFLLGNGDKARLAKQLLSAHGITCTQVIRQGNEEMRSPTDLPFGEGVVLVAVYPPDRERNLLVEFLAQRGYFHGENMHFL